MNAQLRTRKPTGKPAWPILLLAGAEKAGKSYMAAVATGSDLIGRAYWVAIGEDDPDEYGPLGRFEIVEHDGSYRSILDTLWLAARQPLPDEGVPLLVVDSMTRLWNLLTDEAQEHANARAAAKAKKFNRPLPDEEVPVSMDLWNEAKTKWVRVMDALRAFPGPVILTARLDQVTVMNDRGEPTKDRTSKVQAEKSLPFDVGAVIELPARGETWISGVRSTRLRLEERTEAPKDFTIDWFWRQLGLGDGAHGVREHRTPRQESDGSGWVKPIENAADVGELHAVWLEIEKAGQRDALIDGTPVKAVVGARRKALELAAERERAEADAYLAAQEEVKA